MKTSLTIFSKVGSPLILVLCYHHKTFKIGNCLFVYSSFNLHFLLEYKIHESSDCIHFVIISSLAPSTGFNS